MHLYHLIGNIIHERNTYLRKSRDKNKYDKRQADDYQNRAFPVSRACRPYFRCRKFILFEMSMNSIGPLMAGVTSVAPKHRMSDFSGIIIIFLPAVCACVQLSSISFFCT